MAVNDSEKTGTVEMDNVAFEDDGDGKSKVPDIKAPKMDEETQIQNDALLKLNSGLANGEAKEKPPPQSLRERLRNKIYRLNFFHSLVISFSFLTLGFQVGQRGPSFLDLQLITGTDVEKASTFFTAGSIGYLCGSIISGILIDKFNKVMLLTVCVLFLAITCAVIPLCSLYGLMLFIFWANSFCGGFLDTGGNADLMSIWGEADGRPYMQTIHFAFALGGVISPLITAPFLTPVANDQTQNENTSSIANVTSNLTMGNLTTTTEEVGEIRLIYAYIIAGILTLLASVMFLVLFCKLKASKAKDTKKEKKEKEEEKSRELPLKYYIFCIVLLDLYFLFYCSVEDTFAAYLLTFTVLHLDWSKNTSSQLTALFWGSFAVSRFLGIFFIGCIRPVRMMFICTVSLMLSLVLFLLCAYFKLSIGIWFFTVCVGFSLSVIFPTTFTWTQESLFHVNGKVASSFLISASVGTMINPLIIGYLMEEIHPMWYCYLLISHSIVCFLIFLVLLLLSKKIAKVRTHDTKEIEIPVTNETL